MSKTKVEVHQETIDGYLQRTSERARGQMEMFIDYVHAGEAKVWTRGCRPTELLAKRSKGEHSESTEKAGA